MHLPGFLFPLYSAGVIVPTYGKQPGSPLSSCPRQWCSQTVPLRDGRPTTVLEPRQCLSDPPGWRRCQTPPGRRCQTSPAQAAGGAKHSCLAAVPNLPGRRRYQTPLACGGTKCPPGLSSQETTAAGQCSQASSALVSSPREPSVQSKNVGGFCRVEKETLVSRSFPQPISLSPARQCC